MSKDKPLFGGTDACPECGAPLSWRPARPYPVALQIAFGASFVAFLLFFEEIQNLTILVWSWSVFQIVLAFFLVRGRLLAKKRVLHCVRCDAAVR